MSRPESKLTTFRPQTATIGVGPNELFGSGDRIIHARPLIDGISQNRGVLRVHAVRVTGGSLAAHSSSSPQRGNSPRAAAEAALSIVEQVHSSPGSPMGVSLPLETVVALPPPRQAFLEKGAIHLGLTRDASSQTILGGGVGETAAETLLAADLWALQQDDIVDEADAEVAAIKQKRKKVFPTHPFARLLVRWSPLHGPSQPSARWPRSKLRAGRSGAMPRLTSTSCPGSRTRGAASR